MMVKLPWDLYMMPPDIVSISNPTRNTRVFAYLSHLFVGKVVENGTRIRVSIELTLTLPGSEDLFVHGMPRLLDFDLVVVHVSTLSNQCDFASQK